jgi:hypothetical protein
MKYSKDKYIHINDEWAIQGDELCVTLYRKRFTENGVLQYDAKGYFQDLAYALQRMIDMDIQGLNNIQYMCERMDELRKDIMDTLKKLNSGVISSPLSQQNNQSMSKYRKPQPQTQTEAKGVET